MSEAFLFAPPSSVELGDGARCRWTYCGSSRRRRFRGSSRAWTRTCPGPSTSASGCAPGAASGAVGRKDALEKECVKRLFAPNDCLENIEFQVFLQSTTVAKYAMLVLQCWFGGEGERTAWRRKREKGSRRHSRRSTCDRSKRPRAPRLPRQTLVGMREEEEGKGCRTPLYDNMQGVRYPFMTI